MEVLYVSKWSASEWVDNYALGTSLVEWVAYYAKYYYESVLSMVSQDSVLQQFFMANVHYVFLILSISIPIASFVWKKRR